MTGSLIDVVPQPRIDTLVTDAATGLQRRRTEYSGTVWFGGRPQVTSYGTLTRTAFASIESPFFLPDSLPYRPDPLEDALIVVSVAIQGAEDKAHQILEYRAGLEPDPRNPAVCWMQLQVIARSMVPLAVSYRVDALVAMNAILTEAGAG
ncbi:MAG: hypothetical protein A2V85_15365 [Chloroflexi bacterium RBG_16_72_14]|nr:MAG: hypothetical protein A2V85_15365 [Chloroflexi bacterium RBG_16_72_14]